MCEWRFHVRRRKYFVFEQVLGTSQWEAQNPVVLIGIFVLCSSNPQSKGDNVYTNYVHNSSLFNVSKIKSYATKSKRLKEIVFKQCFM